MEKPFDRVPYIVREKPDSTDWNRQESQHDRTLRDVLATFLSGRPTDASYAALARSGFFPVAFKVLPAAPASMVVNVLPGLGFHYLPADAPANIGLTESPQMLGISDLAALKPLVLNSIHQFAVPTAPPATNTRIDIIEVKADRYFTDIDSSRRQLVVVGDTANFDPTAMYKTLSFVLDGRTGVVQAPADSTKAISYKIGVEANPGVVPATTAGYIKIGEVRVGTAVTAIEENKIVDRRKLLAYGGVINGTARFRMQWNGGAPIFTLRSCSLPPDVQIGVLNLAAPQRSAVRFYVVAGEATEVGVTAQVTNLTGVPAVTEYVGTVCSVSATGLEWIQDVDSTIQTNMAAATPAIQAGIGQKVITGIVEGRYINNGGTINSTNGLLEDTEIQIKLAISYT